MCGTDAIRLGLGVEFDHFPRIAARPQSWARGRNPVGIPDGCSENGQDNGAA